MRKSLGIILGLMIFTACLQDDDYLEERFLNVENEYSSNCHQKGEKEIRDSIIIANQPDLGEDGETDDPKVKNGIKGKKKENDSLQISQNKL